MTSSLELPARPARKPSTRTTAMIAAGCAAALALAWYVWFINTPAELGTSGRTASGSTVVDRTLYIGMYAVPDEFDRDIRLSGVKVSARADVAFEIEPLLCRGASVGITSEPQRFCDELVNPEGQHLTAGDSVVLSVSAQEPGVVRIDRIRIGFHEDLRSDTQEAGLAGATVTVSPRSAE